MLALYNKLGNSPGVSVLCSLGLCISFKSLNQFACKTIWVWCLLEGRSFFKGFTHFGVSGIL